MTASDLALYYLTGVTSILTLGFLLKSKFWISWVRGTVAALVGGLCTTSWYIVARRRDWISGIDADVAGVFIFGGFGVLLTLQLVVFFWYNWDYWAWTRQKSENDAIYK